LPAVTPVTVWTPDPNTELINPWRYWVLKTPNEAVEKQSLEDGPGGSRILRITGDYGNDTNINYNFGVGMKLAPGRYSFVFSVRGTPGHVVEFELGNDWRLVSKEAQIPLTEPWRELNLSFEVKSTTLEVTTLRFRLPRNVNGAFDLANTRLKMIAK
jgi:hypothetical protein